MITPVLFPVPIDNRSPVSKESCSPAMLGKELILGHSLEGFHNSECHSACLRARLLGSA